MTADTHTKPGSGVAARPIQLQPSLRPGSSGEDPPWKRLRDTRVGVSIARVVLLAVTIASWQYVSVTQDAGLWIGRPSQILERLADWISSGYIFRHVLVTLTETVTGFVFGAAFGVVMGVILGLSPYFGRVLDPFITAFYSLPKIGLAPLFILWFGIGMEMKTILTATIVFFLVFSNCYAGVRSRDHELMDVLAVMGATRLDKIRKVVLPGSLSYIYVGLKLGVPYALIGAVFGEIIASNQGLGYVLMAAAGQFDTNGLMATLLVLMVFGAGLNGIVQFSQKYVLRWQNIQRR